MPCNLCGRWVRFWMIWESFPVDEWDGTNDGDHYIRDDGVWVVYCPFCWAQLLYVRRYLDEMSEGRAPTTWQDDAVRRRWWGR